MNSLENLRDLIIYKSQSNENGNWWKLGRFSFPNSIKIKNRKVEKMIIIGEIFSLLAALTLAYSTFSNKKNKMIWWQAINAIFYGLSNLFLGGYSAVVTNILTLSRNVLVVKEKLDKKFTIIICILMIIIGVYFNNRAWLGLLPIIASVQYTLCVFILKSAQHMRIALIINLLQWMIFDLLIKAYPMFALDIIIIIVTLINFLRFRSCDEEIKLERRTVPISRDN